MVVVVFLLLMTLSSKFRTHAGAAGPAKTQHAAAALLSRTPPPRVALPRPGGPRPKGGLGQRAASARAPTLRSQTGGFPAASWRPMPCMVPASTPGRSWRVAQKREGSPGADLPLRLSTALVWLAMKSTSWRLELDQRRHAVEGPFV